MRYFVTFRGRQVGALGEPATYSVIYEGNKDDYNSTIILNALYKGKNNKGQKYEHIDLHTVKISLLKESNK